MGQDGPVGADTEEGHDKLVDSDKHAEGVWVVRDVYDGPHTLAAGQEAELDESEHSEFGHSDRRIVEHVVEE